MEERRMTGIQFDSDDALQRLKDGQVYPIRLKVREPFTPHVKGELVVGYFPGGIRTFLEIVNNPTVQDGESFKAEVLDFKLFLVGGVMYYLQRSPLGIEL